MKLLDKYIAMSANENVSKNYRETAEGKNGRIFRFINTNYRYISSIITNYNTFKSIDGVPRTNWEKNKNHGQENLKQHTVNMLKMKFFSKNESIYYKTKKGTVLESIPENYSDEEKWLLIYLLIIDAYFENTPNYVLERTFELMEDFMVYVDGFSEIMDTIKNYLLRSKSLTKADVFHTDYIYFDSFFKPFQEYDLLATYIEATTEEKNELHSYISENVKRKSAEYKCILSWKYKAGGVYDPKMLEENAKLIFMSNVLNVYGKNSKFSGFSEYIDVTLQRFSEIRFIDINKLRDFITLNKDVFEMTYFNIFEPNIFDTFENAEEEVENYDESEDSEIDSTTAVNIKEIRKISSILKKKAIERAEYKCELENLHSCESHYFTSKRTKQNYLEVHHLIPREFSNEFERSIELVENYISLCPRCHRMIHFAEDRERKSAINVLFNGRKQKLEDRKLSVTLKVLYDYYKITDKPSQTSKPNLPNYIEILSINDSSNFSTQVLHEEKEVMKSKK